MSKDYIQHFGIEGQKWGKRRWQYPDGRFNEEGKERYFGKYQKKVDDFTAKSKYFEEKANKHKVNALLDSKKMFFAKPFVTFDNWRFEVNSKKMDYNQSKAIKAMNKFIKNIKKIKMHDKDTKKYLETAKKYNDFISNYQNNLLKRNKENEMYAKLVNKRYFGNDDIDLKI